MDRTRTYPRADAPLRNPMRRADLRQQLAALIEQLEYGCGYEHCVIKPGPSWRRGWEEEREGLGNCICTPPDMALRLRTLARAIKGYQWGG